MNKSQLLKTIGHIVRLQPPLETAAAEQFDDEWSIVDVSTSAVELENLRIGRRTRLAFDGIFSYHEDANRSTEMQKYGFLVLHVSVLLEPDGTITVRPFPSPREPRREASTPSLLAAADAHGFQLVRRHTRASHKSRAKSPAMSVRAASGTANVRGRLLASADVVVQNSGGPFNLVAYAKLGQTSATLDNGAFWEYWVRPVKGGHGQSIYSVATLEPAQSDSVRVVKVRGEQMTMVKRFEGTDAIWFDVEWVLHIEEKGDLTKAMTFLSRVELNEKRDGFVVAIRECVALGTGQMGPKRGDLV